MRDTAEVPCVSTVAPLFNIVNDHPVCTRTWQCAADPELSIGQMVNVGGAHCNVTGKVVGDRFVTYEFSPRCCRCDTCRVCGKSAIECQCEIFDT